MSSANKAKGTRFESDVETFLLDSGVQASRLPRAGAKDIGDLHVRIAGDEYLVIEAKNVKRSDMADWLRQADVEAAHHEAKYGRPSWPVVVAKARGKGIAEARVTMTLGMFIELLRVRGVL